jgi:hypothetical protein
MRMVNPPHSARRWSASMGIQIRLESEFSSVVGPAVDSNHRPPCQTASSAVLTRVGECAHGGLLCGLG